MSHFSKEEYWARRRKGERGQAIDTLEPVRSYSQAGTIELGVNKFKREQSHRFDGHYNPKKKSSRGSVLRDLKNEAWDEWDRRHK